MRFFERSAVALLWPGCLLVCLLAFACSPEKKTSEAAGERVVSVVAAVDLKFAFEEVLTAFRDRHPDIRATAVYGSSGNFFAQLENRAPFDLFLSADVNYPRGLVEKGHATKEGVFVYAVGHVVVWVPRSSSIDVDKLGADALLDPAVRRIAIANPKFAPYGRAAESALKSLKLYDRMKDRLVLGDNVAQAAQFVQTGAADIGIIGQAQALAPTLRAEGRFWKIPQEAYPRLEQGGIVLSWAKDKAAANLLRSFLLAPEGQAVLERYGFSPPGSESAPKK